METESVNFLDRLRYKHENQMNAMSVMTDNPEGVRMKLRALLVALLGVSMSACAFASQPVELELEDDDVAQKLSNVSFARRAILGQSSQRTWRTLSTLAKRVGQVSDVFISFVCAFAFYDIHRKTWEWFSLFYTAGYHTACITKPTIRLVMGYGKLSAFVTAASSLLLLIAVMSKQSWWRRGARWLAAPALLVAALEAASDAGDAMLAAALRGSSEPAKVAAQTTAAAVLVTVEILVWYFIAKFFEYNPPPIPESPSEKENFMKILEQ